MSDHRANMNPATAACQNGYLWDSFLTGNLCGVRKLSGMVTEQEHEVAVAAHFMGYDLMRGREGYVLSRKYGAESEVVTAPTLEEITKHLKH